MARKGLSVWLSSSLIFVALLHMLDAISAFVFGNQTRLLQLYPFIGEQLQALQPSMYFWTSTIMALILWGITCGIAFENPVETFLNKTLSDAKMQSTVETQTVESKSEVLDGIYETIEANKETLLRLKDLVYNVRTEAREIEPLNQSVEIVKADLSTLKEEFRRISERAIFHNICHTCGKPLMPEFNMCPYCGESAHAQIITIKSLR